MKSYYREITWHSYKIMGYTYVQGDIVMVEARDKLLAEEGFNILLEERFRSKTLTQDELPPNKKVHPIALPPLYNEWSKVLYYSISDQNKISRYLDSVIDFRLSKLFIKASSYKSTSTRDGIKISIVFNPNTIYIKLYFKTLISPRLVNIEIGKAHEILNNYE